MFVEKLPIQELLAPGQKEEVCVTLAEAGAGYLNRKRPGHTDDCREVWAIFSTRSSEARALRSVGSSL